jgi:hypothetical protein
VRYSINYDYDRSESRFHPKQYASRCEVTFDRFPRINELRGLIPEIETFDNPNIAVFVKNVPFYMKGYSGTELLYFGNPSASVTASHRRLTMNSPHPHYQEGYGFGVRITLRETETSANELSRVEEVEIGVYSVRYIAGFFRPTRFISLSE